MMTARQQLKHTTFLNIATHFSMLSTCNRLRVGTVIVEDNQIISAGYNGNYAGGPNTCDSEEEGNCGCIHAETNAILKYSPRLYKNATLYTTTSPCISCAKMIINAGIKEVIFAHEYRDIKPIEIMSSTGIKVGKFA